MANEKGSASGPAGGDDKRLRPEPPVIDLTATDLSKAQTTPGSEQSTADPAGVDSAGLLDADALEPEPDKAPIPSATDTTNRTERRRLRRAGMLTGAGTGLVAGTLAAAVLLGALWWIGWLADARDTGRTDRIATLENQVRTLSARREPSPPPLPPAQDAELARRIGELEQTGQRYAALDARLTKAEAAVNAQPAAAASLAGDPALGQQLAAADAANQALRQEVAAFRKRLDEVAASAQGARDVAMQSTGATSAAAADTAGDLARIGERLKAAEGAVAAMQVTIAKAAAPEADRAARTATAAVALQAAVERGAPFGMELAAVRALLGDNASLQPLTPIAATGLTPQPALMRELATLIVTTRRTTSSKDAEGTSMLDRLQASASNLIRVQPADQPSGQPQATAAPTEPMARLEAAAARNDMTAALAAIEALPADQQSAFAAWKAKAQTQIAARKAAQEVAAQSIAALAAAPR